VLVANIKSVEDGKLVVRWLRSLARLHLIENVPEFIRDAGSDLDTDTTMPVGRGWNIKDREDRGFVRPSAASNNELPRKMVQ
jgi:hypothetical protein